MRQHDGSILKLRKLAPEYDPTSKIAAMTYLQERQAAGEIVTGLLYVDPEAEDLHDRLEHGRDARSTRSARPSSARAARRSRR